jgi:transcriptional regulator with XRE-family HTH domain
MNHRAFAAWLKRAREDAGLSQPDLAAQIGVKKAYISKLENANRGLPTLDRLVRLSKALGTPLSSILVVMGYLKPEREIEPHVMRMLHYYQSLPETEQKLAEEIIKTLWRERGIREEKSDASDTKRKSA